MAQNSLSLNSGYPPTVRVAKLGTLNEPVFTGTTLNTNSWFPRQMLPVASILKQAIFYCATSGTVTIKIAQPVKGGSFNIIQEQALSVVQGRNLFSVDKGNLTTMAVPAYSMVGFRSSAGSVVYYNASPTSSLGIMASSSNLTGNNVIIDVAAGFEAQYQFNLEYVTGQSNPQYFIDENFAGTKLPAYGSHFGTVWTYTAGKATPGATGLNNQLNFLVSTQRSFTNTRIEFIFRASGDRVAITRNGITGAQGMIGEADLNNNKIVLYGLYTGGATLPSVTATKTLTSLTLTIGVQYRLELIRNGGYNGTIQLTITDTSSGINETVSTTNDGSASTGLCNGAPGIASLAGTTWELKDFKFYPQIQNPYFIVIGDSITNGAFATAGNPWAEQTVNHRSGSNAAFSGSPGSNSVNWIIWVHHEMNLSLSNYLIVAIGINDTGTDPLAAQWQLNMITLYGYINNRALIPIFCGILPSSTGSINTRVQGMNTFFSGKQWYVIKMNIPMSLGNDGVTYDSSLSSDGTHPNTTGHTLMYNRTLIDTPFLF